MSRPARTGAFFTALTALLTVAAVIAVTALIKGFLPIEAESDAAQCYDRFTTAAAFLCASLRLLLCSGEACEDIRRRLPPKRRLPAWCMLPALTAGLCIGCFKEAALSLIVRGSLPERDALAAALVRTQGYPAARWLNLLMLSELICFCIAGPVFEELLCRGVLLSGLRRHMPFWAAAGISSLFFALLHLEPRRIPDTFLAGILLSLAVYFTGSLLLPICIHCGMNLFTSVSANMICRDLIYTVPGFAAAAVLLVLSACLMLSFCKAQPNTEEEPITE